MLANQWIQYCVSTPTQVAMANVLKVSDHAFEGKKNYYDYIRCEYETKRDLLASSLRSASLNPIIPEGGFFIMADTSAHSVPEKYFSELGPTGDAVTRDWAFARYLTTDWGVTPIPPSAFYTKDRAALATNLARFAFCKTDESLQEADKRLRLLGNAIR